MLEDFNNIKTVYYRYAKSRDYIELTSHDTEEIISAINPCLTRFGFNLDSSYVLNHSFFGIYNGEYPESILLSFKNIHTTIEIKFNYSGLNLYCVYISIFGYESLSRLPNLQFKRSRNHSYVIYLDSTYEVLESCLTVFTKNLLFPQFQLSFDSNDKAKSIKKFQSLEEEFSSKEVSLKDVSHDDIHQLIAYDLYSDCELADDLLKERFGPTQDYLSFNDRITIIEAYHI